MYSRKVIHLILIVFGIIVSCTRGQKAGEKEVIPKAPVTVITVSIGTMTDFAELTATSTFFDNAVVKAPVTGYIESSLVNPGDLVMKNQKILTMRTKEAVALKTDTSGSFGFSGEILIRSGISGVVTSMDHPVGDYVQEGDRLGLISVPGSLVFILDAPFDLNSYIRIGNRCDVLLPDGSKFEGRIKSRLPSMSGASQTQRFVIEPLKPPKLPENLIARVRVPKKSIINAVMLPKSCILTDEVMRNFWVMKLINDSVAVKIPIRTGLTEGGNVQILEPPFSLSDLFLSSGNYGLGDTARVVVVKKKE